MHGERKSDSEHLPTAGRPNSRLCTAQGRPTSPLSPGAASCRTAHGCTTEGTGCHRGVAQHDCRSLQLSVTVIRIFGSKYGKRIHCKRIRPPALMVSEKLSSRTWTAFRVRGLLDSPEQKTADSWASPMFRSPSGFQIIVWQLLISVICGITLAWGVDRVWMKIFDHRKLFPGRTGEAVPKKSLCRPKMSWHSLRYQRAWQKLRMHYLLRIPLICRNASVKVRGVGGRPISATVQSGVGEWPISILKMPAFQHYDSMSIRDKASFRATTLYLQGCKPG